MEKLTLEEFKEQLEARIANLEAWIKWVEPRGSSEFLGYLKGHLNAAQMDLESVNEILEQS
jgi:hypothetical protein